MMMFGGNKKFLNSVSEVAVKKRDFPVFGKFEMVMFKYLSD